MMDLDLDFSLAPSETIYPQRCIKLDPANAGKCYLGSKNAMCVGVSIPGSEVAPGAIGNGTPPYVLAESGTPSGFAAGSAANVAVFGEGRKCLIDVDPNFGGQIKPNDLIISSDAGTATPAATTGSWNQWVVGIALTFASAGQQVFVTVKIFPWLPTGS